MTASARAAGLVFLGVLATAVLARRAWRQQRARLTRRRLGSATAARAPQRPPSAGPAWFGRAVVAAGFGALDPARLWQGWTVGGATVAVVLAIAFGPWAGAVGALAVAATPVAVLWSLRDRGGTRYEAMLPELLDDVAAALRSGASLLGALGTASARAPAEVGSDVRAVVDAIERGGQLDDELDRWHRRRPLPSVLLAAAALSVGASTGGRQARAVDTVGATLRDRAAVRREAAALATQSRASALVMAVIPLVFAVAAATLDPRVGHVLVHTPVGVACLSGGLALDGVAGLWMARITRGVR